MEVRAPDIDKFRHFMRYPDKPKAFFPQGSRRYPEQPQARSLT